MCQFCGEKIGCKWTGGKLVDEKALTADDWRSIYDFIKFVQLPFFHGLIMRTRERKATESEQPIGYRQFSWKKCPECGQRVKHNWLKRHIRSGCKKG